MRKLAGPHVPASLKALERAVARVHQQAGECSEKHLSNRDDIGEHQEREAPENELGVQDLGVEDLERGAEIEEAAAGD